MCNLIENEEKTIEVEIDINKVYHFPKQISITKYKDYFLVIYTEGILWLVFQEQQELQVFKDLKSGYSIKNVLDKYNEDLVMNVVMQIEAKKFETPNNIILSENNIYIYLTNNCNQRCKHCYMYAGDIKIGELSVDDWKGVLKDFKQAGGNGVTFTGGEVTVYKGFEEILRFSHELGLIVTVLSNGILWSEEKIQELHKYIDEIQISIDGYDKDSYYNVRQYNGFSKAIDCIINFYNVGTKVSMAVTPLYNDIDNFIVKFEKFALDFISKYPKVFIKLNLELIAGREVNTSPEENKNYRKKLMKLVERLYPNYYAETFVLNYENKVLRKNCGFGEVSIAANGDVFWCNRIHELVSSINIQNISFKKLFEISEKIKNSTSVDNTTICRNCDVKYICGGGCRIKYPKIREVDTHQGQWNYVCEGKNHIYEKMILGNEYFFEE